jgi:hypothetical protein
VRRAFISPRHHLWLDVAAAAERGVPSGFGVKRRLPAIALTSLLQAGVERLEVHGPEYSVLPAYLKRRVTYAPLDTMLQSFVQLHSLLSASAKTDAQRRTANNLAAFLTEIIYAAETGKHVIKIRSGLRLSHARRWLPRELLVPIENLVRTIELVTPRTIVPSFEIEKNSVVLLEEIMEGKHYERYVAAHEVLGDATLPAYVARDLVTASAAPLMRLNRALFRRRSTVITLLTGSAKIVDACAKVPGVLATIIAAAITRWLETRSRVVIYDLSGHVEDERKRLLAEGRSDGLTSR